MKPCALSMQIATVLPTLQGWCTLEKALALADAVLELKPDIVVELGVFGGSSLIPMALACKQLGRGTVVGVDPWSKSASVEGYDAANAEWWGKLDHDAIMQGFLDAIAKLELTQRVVVKRLKSDDFPPPTVIDLLHIDAQHTDQAVRDVERFVPHVRKSGLVCVDDIEWSGGGVRRAVDLLLTMGFVQLYPIGTGAMFKRVKK